jgi:tRNA-specific 2-thiouridylase
MSGGVDSSVAAALLKEQGCDVYGVTLNLAVESSVARMAGAIESARKTARMLGISHDVIDVRATFEEKVVSVFCEEYRHARTPNPCVVCNRQLKLKELRRVAGQRAAEYVATGHYAQAMYDEERGRYLLKKGKDARKEQSYFLSLLTQEQLGAVLFPLGSMSKSAVRDKAKALDLPVHDRRGSQEVCFIPDNDYSSFISARMPDLVRPGPIVSTAGEVLGSHQGIHRFTVGQRKGLNVPQGYPVYVTALNSETNTVVVGKKEETYRSELTATGLNWIAIDKLKEPIKVHARIRYRNREQPAQVIPLPNDVVKVVFDEPQMAITPGQAVVFYDGDMVVGGGWIKG